MNLSDLEKDKTVVIESLSELSKTKQIRLMELGFVPGKEIKRVQSSILNGPIAFEIEGTIVALSKEDANLISFA